MSVPYPCEAHMVYAVATRYTTYTIKGLHYFFFVSLIYDAMHYLCIVCEVERYSMIFDKSRLQMFTFDFLNWQNKNPEITRQKVCKIAHAVL